MEMLTGGYFPPLARLPEVKTSDGDFGVTDPKLFGAPIPIRGLTSHPIFTLLLTIMPQKACSEL